MLIFCRFEIHLKIDLPIFLLSRNCDESCDRSAKLLPKGLKIKVRLVICFDFFCRILSLTDLYNQIG